MDRSVSRGYLVQPLPDRPQSLHQGLRGPSNLGPFFVCPTLRLAQQLCGWSSVPLLLRPLRPDGDLPSVPPLVYLLPLKTICQGPLRACLSDSHCPGVVGQEQNSTATGLNSA